MSEWDNFNVDGIQMIEGEWDNFNVKGIQMSSYEDNLPRAVITPPDKISSVDYMMSRATMIVKPNRYMVRIGSASYVLAHNVSLPGRTIQTRNDDHYSVGRTYKTAYATDISQLTIQFYTSYNRLLGLEDNLIYFDEWMAGTLKNSVVYNKTDGRSEQYANYTDQYIKDIEIDLINDFGDVINTWTIIGAYPTAISHDELSYGNTTSMFSVTVTFDAMDIIASAAHSSSSGDLIGLLTSGGRLSMPDIVTSVSGMGSNILDGANNPFISSFSGLSISNFGTTPGEGEVKSDWLGDLKRGYMSAKDSVSDFLGGANTVIDARVMDVAKTMASKFVAAKINGTKFDAAGSLKQVAAPTIGSVVGGLTQDPALSKVLNRQTQNIVLGMPNAVKTAGKQAAINEIQELIKNVPSKPITPTKPF